jgi:aryl-alcohol dehydrogenase-like predicted oxidoreductase
MLIYLSLFLGGASAFLHPTPISLSTRLLDTQQDHSSNDNDVITTTATTTTTTPTTPSANNKIELTKNISIAPLGIGTWAWGDKFFWGYDSSQDPALYDTFKACVDNGITFFDTAEIYGFGKSELLLGRFARESGSKVQFATKFAPIPLPWRLGGDAVVDACIDSLDRLGSSSCALYQLHWPVLFQNDNYLDGLAKCYERGLCSGVGVSNYGDSQLRYAHKKLASKGIPLISNQISYSLLARSPETNGVLKAAKELNVKTLAYSPLAQGILTGKFNDNNLPSGSRKIQVKAILPKVKPLLDEMRAMSVRYEKSMSQIALNWCIMQGVIPIPGARSVSQAVDNCGALGWNLADADIIRLNELSRQSGVDMTTPLMGK